MPAQLTSADIDRIAAEWAAREDLRPLDPGEEQVLDAWLAADMRHLGAYGKARAVLLRAAALHDDAPIADASPGPAPARPTRRWMLGAMAASVVAVAGGSALMLRDRRPAEKHFATARGEIRSLPLEDGSTVMLNTASEIAVAFLPDQRIVRLIAGEAFFQVARDAARPFLVESAGRIVQSVGTAFAMRRVEEGVGVMVREGRIRFERPQQASSASALLFADSRTEIRDYTASDPPLVQHHSVGEMDRMLAWLDDKIVFNETTLGEAAVEFHRYSETPILMAPEVQKLRVSGRYSAGNPEAFAKAVSQILDLRMVRTAQGIEISPRD